ncbi:MAG: amino acid adenylation protein [Parcubacteria group bacterium Gr01-1014_19]|nr:MAG: amino acid adenylation protein [Parcubacteria group bacterium Gr01-1014_19]
MIKLVQEYFSESARKYPDHPAVVFGERRPTFSELEKSSNQFARFLRDKGVRKGDRVAFCLSKSVEAIESILGILKADAVYVPLNAKAPKARMSQIIEDARPALVICDMDTSKLVGEVKIFNIQTDRSSILGFEDRAVDYQNAGSDPAYILYTSGSTGVPKGVMITHDNIINATDWAVDEFGISHGDRLSQHPPLYFDLSTFDLYCAFSAGATLFLVPESLSIFPGQLMRFIEENELTIWDSVPSVMVYLSNADVVKAGRMPSVRKIFFNGEGFPARFLAEWMKTFPEKEFINMYGPTETTVQCTFYRIPEPPQDLTKLVPIGKACRGVEVFDVEGELYVAGKGVGKGYWNNSEKTKASFVPDARPGKSGLVYKTGDLVSLREDGNYEFIGRKDFQVKIMGNRIELGDVEAALLALPCVAEAAVIAVAVNETDGSEMVGFVKLKEAREESLIKADLANLIPSYMIPAKIVVQDFLPRTSTGKVDRNKLKDGYKV